MAKLLAVASCEIGRKTKIKTCIPANTRKEKNKKVKLACWLNFKKVGTF